MDSSNSCQTIAIVDAYSTGNQLASLLADKGIRVIHIQSTEIIPDLLSGSFLSDTFDQNYVFSDDFEELVKHLKQQNPSHIVAGSETGILLADRLSNTLSLQYCNSYALSEARRDKFLMLEAIRKHGIHAAKQTKSSSLAELKSFANNVKAWPLVLKPINSSSSDGLFFVNNLDELSRAIEKVLDQKNILGIVNDHVLLQEALIGIQYIINTVSFAGHHCVTDVWKMTVRHTDEIPMIIDAMELVDNNDPNFNSLITYTKNVLNALGIKNGPVHSEVMMTTSGPSLIEINARLMGGNIDSCFKDALGGYTQVDAFIDSLLNPDQLLSKYSDRYKLDTNLAEVDFVFYRSGILSSFDKQQAIMSLASFHSFAKMPLIGTKVDKTADTTNRTGLLYLINKDQSQLHKDLELVLNWQLSDQLFTINES